MEKNNVDSSNVPFCFPVVYHGLIAAHTKYNQEEALSILLYGFREYGYCLNRSEASIVTSGKMAVRPIWIKDFNKLDASKRLQNIEDLNIAYAEEVVSVFHTYLCSEECEVLVQPWQLERLRSVANLNDNPCAYILDAVEITFSEKKERNEPWVSIESQIEKLATKLHKLLKTEPFENLYARNHTERYLAAAPQRALEILSEAAVPYVLKTIFVALIPGIETIPDASEYIQRGDYCGLIKSAMPQGNMSYWDRWRWLTRRLPIAEMANAILSEASESDEELFVPADINIGWFINFFEKAGEVSEEDMRRLWAKVLAREIRKPGTFSEKSIRVLLDLDATAAYCFEHVSRFLIKNTAQPREPQFIIDTTRMHKGINSNFGICTEDLNLLTSYGILSSRMSSEFTFMAVKEPGQWDEVLSNRDERIVIKMKIKTPEDCRRFSYVKYELTPVGKELLTIMPEPDEDYLPMLGACLAAEIGDGYEVGVYRVTKTQISHGDFTVKAGSGMITLYRHMAEEEEYLDLEHNLLIDLPFEEKLREAFHRYNEQAEDVEE